MFEVYLKTWAKVKFLFFENIFAVFAFSKCSVILISNLLTLEKSFTRYFFRMIQKPEKILHLNDRLFKIVTLIHCYCNDCTLHTGAQDMTDLK